MDLQEIRKQLDSIDTEFVRLFEKRMKLCADVAEFKIKTGKAVYDPQREQEKIASVRGMAEGEFMKEAVGELFLQMMTLSRRYQYRLMEQVQSASDFGFQRVEDIEKKNVRIAYQGLEGAYSHAAVIQFFGEQADMFHVRRFEDAARAVFEGRADYAVLPIENSSAGAVSDNYDLLLKYENYIVAEVFVPVCHCLLGTQDAELSDIRTVLAHPQALMQSSQYLNAREDWSQISVENNAVAARTVSEGADKSQAAVASRTAAEIYGLKVLEEGINHNRENTTRFLILSKQPVYRKDADKVSICFELPHESGTLYNMLNNFAFSHLNMRMIESRPIPGRNWEYRFFVDIEGNLDDPDMINALKGIAGEANHMRILGNY
mgnify:FL=1